ncbi:MAG: cobalamin B12-binding domain-containing protein, partial [Methanosarcinales archaeon]|nr:cobalamin B12-binding domain-containing protein [Methanosarcinales archaeon]
MNKQPTIVFIGGMASTPSLPRSLAISSAIKELDNEIEIVLGGTHPTFMYNNIMKEHPCIDYIVRGEGEITWDQFLLGHSIHSQIIRNT